MSVLCSTSFPVGNGTQLPGRGGSVTWKLTPPLQQQLMMMIMVKTRQRVSMKLECSLSLNIHHSATHSFMNLHLHVRRGNVMKSLSLTLKTLIRACVL